MRRPLLAARRDASPLAIAALPFTSTVTERGGDFVGETFTNAAVGGPPGALQLLSGSLPDRGDAPCQGPVRLPTAVAVDGSVLDRHVRDRGLAVGGGRVLYERLRPHDRSELILRRLAGGERRLARFGPGRRRVGDVDVDATRATWATESRIVVQRLR